MNNFQNILKDSEAVKTAVDVGISLGQRVYLVGGTVRDLLLHARIGNDFDFAVAGKGIPFAKSFAEKIGGNFFVLDEERDTARVVSKSGFQADFSGLRGSIDEDLGLRDFTINAMAISLHEQLIGKGRWLEAFLLDPTGGRRDMEGRVIKATYPSALKDDPLRILRAFRFSSAFSFKIDSALLDRIMCDSQMLAQVSAERIRAELFMILNMPGADHVLREMDGAGVLRVLFPEVEKWKDFYQGGWHAHDLFEHSMKTVEAMEELLGNAGFYLSGYGSDIELLMNEELEDHVTRRGVLKLASLLHDSGKFYTRVMEGNRGRFFGHEITGERISAEIAGGLKLSRMSERMLRTLTANHMRMLGISKLKNVTPRARFRFFRDAEGFGIELLLLCLADIKATPIEGDGFEEMKGLVREMADYYFLEYAKAPPLPLLSGEDIMRIFGVSQGKKIGEMLESLREAEIMGKVSEKQEAIEYLKKIFV